MAWRDSKASRRRLVLFSLCVVFGIAALVALDSFTVALSRAIGDESKALLGADLVLTSRQPLSPDAVQAARAVAAETAESVTFSTMLVAGAPGSPTRLVQLRAWEGGYPFYGEVETDPPAALAQLRAAERTGARVVVLEETLLAQFRLHPGGKVRLGRADFTIAGGLKKISGESLAVTLLAPRVLLPLRSLADAGLAPTGPLVRHELAIRLPAGRDPDRIAESIRGRFPHERLSVETVAGRRRQLGRALNQVGGFLSLVGFIALLLGSIGVASAVHAHVRRKLPTVALLRCVGVRSSQAFAIYLIQGSALGAIGAVAGAILGLAVQALLPAVIGSLVPIPIHFEVAWPALGRGMVSGFVICLLFTLLPLLGLRQVSPLAAIRGPASDDDESARAGRGARALVLAGIGAAVAGFAIWQTKSVRVGLGFTVAVAAALGVFSVMAWAIAALFRRWSPPGFPYVARQGIANLHRPQNRTGLLLVSLGLGTFLFFSLFLTRTAFLRQLDEARGGERPNLMFFDIQDDQIGPIQAMLSDGGRRSVESAAVVTMKVAKVRGETVEALLQESAVEGRGPPFDSAQGRRPRRQSEGSGRPAEAERVPGWTLRREYRSTFRDHLSATEKLVSGVFTGRADPAKGPVPISVDEGLADEMKLSLGDRIDWDVQGVPVPTVVGSIRSVEWRRLEPNFFVVFPQGVLDDAPKFYVVALRAPSPDESGALQSQVVAKFPNVSAIDLASILATLDDIFRKAAFVVEFMALFTAATAVLVLGCAIVAGRHQRRKEAVLLRTLGASARQLSGIQAVEYALLGLLGAVVGCLLGWGGAAALDHWVFRLPVAAPFAAFASAAAAVIAVTLATGWIADRGLPRHPPLEVLRAED